MSLRDAVLDLAVRMECADGEAGQAAREFAFPAELRAIVNVEDIERGQWVLERSRLHADLASTRAELVELRALVRQVRTLAPSDFLHRLHEAGEDWEDRGLTNAEVYRMGRAAYGLIRMLHGVDEPHG